LIGLPYNSIMGPITPTVQWWEGDLWTDLFDQDGHTGRISITV